MLFLKVETQRIMNKMIIQEIILRKEDQTFDCKSIQIDPKALAITIVAFANADGGTIAIGCRSHPYQYRAVGCW